MGDIEGDAAAPIPNRADAAWERLQALRTEARDLGIEVTEREPIAELELLIRDRRP